MYRISGQGIRPKQTHNEAKTCNLRVASPLNAQPRFHDGVTSPRTREEIDGRKQEERRTVHTWHPAVKIDGTADVKSGIQHSHKNGQGPRDGSQPRVSTKSERGKAKQQENACYQESEPDPEAKRWEWEKWQSSPNGPDARIIS